MKLTDKQVYAVYRLKTGVEEGLKHQTLGGYAGTGKASCNSAIVYTPFGPKEMGKVKIGDLVSNPDGSVARVIGVYPQGKKPVFRVSFIDGSSTHVTSDHLWLFHMSSKKYKAKKRYLGSEQNVPFEVNNTQFLRNYLEQEVKKKRPSYPLVPLTKPVQFTIIGNEQRLTVDPYLLGLLLGDGGLTDSSIGFTSADKVLVNAFRKKGFDVTPRSETSSIDYRFWGKKSGELKNSLVKLNLYGKYSHDKFIPKDYLYASIESRFSILQGLMDTDGSCDKKGGCEYSSVSKELAEGVQFLVRSLGGKATWSEKIGKYKCKDTGEVIECKTVYRLYIQFPDKKSLFRLTRKQKNCKSFNGGASVLKNRMISIELDGEEECTCIQVDHPNSLYITDDFIVTHNTTVVKYLTKFFPDFAVCAFTGKAANVLRKKNVGTASTIHSLIYIPVIENGVLVGFELTNREDLGCNGFIVDEASMVSKDIFLDLKSYDLPMIFVGDHGQLEPIGTDFNLMAKPDYRLEEIHRNAGDIAIFAEHLRMGKRATSYKTQEKVQFLDKNYITDEDLLSVDQVICAYNKTRVAFNQRIRAALGYTSNVPEIGERVMCLKNNKQFQLFNGMQGVVKAIYKDGRKNMMDFEFDGNVLEGIWYDTRFFNCEKPELDKIIGRDNPNPFDFAYTITTHKAQGDEFDKVLVFEQYNSKWDHKRWAYTAASRAKEQLFWAC